MKNITIILPVHRLDGIYKEMLSNSIKSVEQFHNDVNLSIVCPSSLKTELVKTYLLKSWMCIKKIFKRNKQTMIVNKSLEFISDCS
jgi:hypothetical protein